MKNGYSKQLVMDYVTGAYIEDSLIETLENNEQFMTDVIKYSKDKKIYYLCSEQVKKSGTFLKFLIQTFPDDMTFLCSIINEHFALREDDIEDITEKEIIILMSDLIQDTDLPNYFFYKLLRESIYSLEVLKYEYISELEENPILKQEIGLGFLFVIDNYGESTIIKNFYAKRMLQDIFYKKEKHYLEDWIHTIFDNREQLEHANLNQYLIDHIKNYDFYLANHIASNPYLLDELKKDIIQLGKNWKYYTEEMNQRKLAIFNQEFSKLMEDYVPHGLRTQTELLRKAIDNQNLDSFFQTYDCTYAYIKSIERDIFEEAPMTLKERRIIQEIEKLLQICKVKGKVQDAELSEKSAKVLKFERRKTATIKK